MSKVRRVFGRFAGTSVARCCSSSAVVAAAEVVAVDWVAGVGNRRNSGTEG